MKTPTTQLIVNADDFGFSPGVTDGILQSHRQGILTSTTLMTTMPDRDRAMELARGAPELGVGIHLCLTQGRPCAGKLDRGLLTAGGFFPRSLPHLISRITLRPKALWDVEAEWAAQIEYALNSGLKPTHLDSHKHVHHWPTLGKIALDLAKRYNIGFVRCARETPIPGIRTPVSYKLLSRLAGRLAHQGDIAGVRHTDWFFGLATTGRTDSAIWLRLLDYLPEGLGEVMVHPGDPSGITCSDTRLLKERTLEQTALCDLQVKEKLQAVGVELTHYGHQVRSCKSGIDS